MGEAVDNPPAPSTAAAAAGGAGFETRPVDDLWFLNPNPVSNEEEEELECLSNIDAFPPLDTSLTFEPTAVSTASIDLEALETAVVQELVTEGVEERETEKDRVPRKRRSKLLQRRRQVLSNFHFLLAGESNKEKQPPVRRCTHCLVDETPQWRQGPAGPGTLCNACGVRYKSGRLYAEYRPANSPTFSPGKHSNFHRKVLEMRGGKQIDGKVILSQKQRCRLRLSDCEHGRELHDTGG